MHNVVQCSFNGNSMTATQVVVEVSLKVEVFDIVAPCRLVHSDSSKDLNLGL